MAETLHEIESEWTSKEVPDGEVITRVWQTRYGATIISALQERGDIVSGTTYYEILSSHMARVQGKMQQKLRVTGFRSDLYTGEVRTSAFRELLKSRTLKQSRNQNLYYRRWECDDTAIQQGENGWGASVDGVATGVTQTNFTLTATGGTVFYPAMIGLPVVIAGEDNIVVTGYTSQLILTVANDNTFAGATTATFRGQLPAEIGDAFGSGSWSNQIEPACVSVSVDPSWTIKRSLITATYSAPRRR